MVRRVPSCGETSENAPRLPTTQGEFRHGKGMESVLGLGHYVPFQTHVRPGEFMFKLAVQKRLIGGQVEAGEMVSSARAYLDDWTNCVGEHQDAPGTFCYGKEFRSLMRGRFDQASKLLAELARLAEGDIADFGTAQDFSKKWNLLQRVMHDTFFAHMAYYPAWLDQDGGPQARRDSCADCHLFDAIEPPVPAFIGLSAFFTPRAAKMPDGTEIPEGVILHEKATGVDEIHEHAHAYLQERKAPGARPRCDWIDEGIADWSAIAVAGATEKGRSVFYEMYDFWLVLHSMPEADRIELITAWCREPGKYDWGALVEDGIESVRRKRKECRGAMSWATSEARVDAFDMSKYLRRPTAAGRKFP